MKADYWEVTDAQVEEKTGRTIAAWSAVMEEFLTVDKKPVETVNYLQNEFGVPRYWARTLTTRYLIEKGKIVK